MLWGWTCVKVQIVDNENLNRKLLGIEVSHVVQGQTCIISCVISLTLSLYLMLFIFLLLNLWLTHFFKSINLKLIF